MKISDIKQQVKRQDRYSIYIDGKYVLSFGEAEMLRLGLRIGQEITVTELEELKTDASLDKAYDRALNLIARRPRSEWEVRFYLKRKEYEQETIDKIVNRLSDRGYIDDMKFARAWVESRRLLKSMSKRKLGFELRAKRVSDEITKAVLEEDETTDAEQLVKVIESKRQQSRYKDDDKLLAYLMRQGYGYADVRAAMKQDVEPDNF